MTKKVFWIWLSFLIAFAYVAIAIAFSRWINVANMSVCSHFYCCDVYLKILLIFPPLILVTSGAIPILYMLVWMVVTEISYSRTLVPLMLWSILISPVTLYFWSKVEFASWFATRSACY